MVTLFFMDKQHEIVSSFYHLGQNRDLKGQALGTDIMKLLGEPAFHIGVPVWSPGSVSESSFLPAKLPPKERRRSSGGSGS